MNNQNLILSSPAAEALQARVALRMASVLSDGTRALPHDVTERLRFAREAALARARAAAPLAAVAGTAIHNGASTLALSSGAGRGGQPNGWWLRFASMVPLVALVGGLVMIQQFHASSQVSAAAEVDSELLADELPPTAYSDPGFVEFLKTPRN